MVSVGLSKCDKFRNTLVPLLGDGGGINLLLLSCMTRRSVGTFVVFWWSSSDVTLECL